MTGTGSLTPSGSSEYIPRRKNDVEVAKDLWKFINQKVDDHRERREQRVNVKADKFYESDSLSMMSKADTLVVEKENILEKK
ncbi:hypothetical protein N7495_002856 [Penicillium taxi]|uniref:uncharacterized protein n=1 Tax=Penicillium taxi TaxID=168475 RepID=UPI002545B8A0|nr:uncharacterized protein N7495_002856 [Penicillium taxi]KAJ5902328.1 hypothetical protein N7495_002856 [Penicillium taxi]